MAATVGVRRVAGNLSTKLPWDLANPKWAASLNPLLKNPIVNGNFLYNQPVVTGNNVINHGLGAELQGWIVIRNSAAVTFYDRQSANPHTDLTLILVASGAATISLYVF